VRVTLESGEPDGLARMLAGLIEANLARHPERRSLLADAVFELVAPDAGVSATIRIEAGRVRVAPGSGAGDAHVCVLASSRDLLMLAASPLRAGLPDPLAAEGRAVLGRVLRRRIRIDGLLGHPVRLSRLARLLSVV
jgi:hypothetical protein